MSFFQKLRAFFREKAAPIDFKTDLHDPPAWLSLAQREPDSLLNFLEKESRAGRQGHVILGLSCEAAPLSGQTHGTSVIAMLLHARAEPGSPLAQARARRICRLITAVPPEGQTHILSVSRAVSALCTNNQDALVFDTIEKLPHGNRSDVYAAPYAVAALVEKRLGCSNADCSSGLTRKCAACDKVDSRAATVLHHIDNASGIDEEARIRILCAPGAAKSLSAENHADWLLDIVSKQMPHKYREQFFLSMEGRPLLLNAKFKDLYPPLSRASKPHPAWPHADDLSCN